MRFLSDFLRRTWRSFTLNCMNSARAPWEAMPALVHAIRFLFSHCLWPFEPPPTPSTEHRAPPPPLPGRPRDPGTACESSRLLTLFTRSSLGAPWASDCVYLRRMHNLMQIMHLFRFVSFHFTCCLKRSAASGGKVARRRGSEAARRRWHDGLTTRDRKCTTPFRINASASTEFAGIIVSAARLFMQRKIFSGWSCRNWDVNEQSSLPNLILVKKTSSCHKR